jgi:hypothetical protein
MIVFPQYIKVFSKAAVTASLALLGKFTSPKEFLAADKRDVIALIRKTASFGLAYAENKYAAIMSVAETALSFATPFPATSRSFACT